MALSFARYGYILENGRVVMDGEAKSLAENEDVKEFYLGISGGRPQILPRRQALQAPQALAGVRPCPSHYDALETRDPAAREREQAAALPQIVAHAMTAPGWARHLAGIDPKSVNSRAALAKLPVLRKSDIAALQKEHPPFGGLNVTPPGKARRLLMSPGPIFEPEGERRGLVRRRARAFRRRLSRRRHRAQFLRLSPNARRVHSGIRLRARSAAQSFPAASAIPSSSSKRSRITSRPAMSARRISSRSCSTPRRRPARTLPRSSAPWCRARRCRPPCATSSSSAASLCCNVTPPPSSA